MSDLAIVYQYFTLDQWKQMAKSIENDLTLTKPQKLELLQKFPSAALVDVI